MASLLLIVICAFSASLRWSTALQLRKLGAFPISHAAFASVGHEGDSPGSNWTLLISSFSALPGSDALHYVRNLEQYLPNKVSDIRPLQLTTQVTWPNECKFVPSKENIQVLALSFYVTDEEDFLPIS